MPLDSLTLYALLGELKPRLEGTKIDKVQQPERDALLLSMRSQGENLKLLISVGTGSARVHFTSESFENPQEPPMFCMLMRKYLVGSRISCVEQPDNERMIVMELDAHDEMGFDSRKKLVIELIGRSSNVILVGSDGRIIDCMRRMDFGGDELRRMLPGMIYRLPPKQSKVDFLSSDGESRRAALAGADRSMPVDKLIMSVFSGISPLISREIACRCNDDPELLPDILDVLSDSLNAGEFTPYMVSDGGKPIDYSFMPLKQYAASAAGEKFDSFSELLDAFYSRKDRLERSKRRSRELTHSIKTVRDRLERKLANQRTELKNTEGREELRRRAELIKANLYRIKKGDSQLVCEDYYQEDCPQITIPLDVTKSPQLNSTALFKEYNKKKTAEKYLTGLIEQGEKQLEYLNSVLTELDCCESERDISDIRRELYETGYLKKQKNGKTEKIKPQAPLKFISTDGFEILVGRNNVQNDELTTKLARRTDIWLHTKNVHGSHVIIRCDGVEPPDETVEQAAIIAAWYSQGREGKTAVDYTMVKNVRKPSGAMPGKVIYTEQHTLFVSADEALAAKLKKS